MEANLIQSSENGLLKELVEKWAVLNLMEQFSLLIQMSELIAILN